VIYYTFGTKETIFVAEFGHFETEITDSTEFSYSDDDDDL